MEERKIPGKANMPIKWTIPAILYGLKYSKRVGRIFSKLYPDFADDFKVIYKTKGRDKFTGMNLPHIKRVVDQFNEDILDFDSVLFKGIKKIERKIPKYNKKYFEDVEKHHEFRDNILWYSHVLQRRKEGESVQQLLKGAPYKVKKYFFDNVIPKTGEERKYPKMSTMAMNFTKSMTEWMKTGFEVADKKMVEDRLKICQQCEFWDGDAMHGTGRCTQCGCSTAFKLRIQTEHCPINKW